MRRRVAPILLVLGLTGCGRPTPVAAAAPAPPAVPPTPLRWIVHDAGAEPRALLRYRLADRGASCEVTTESHTESTLLSRAHEANGRHVVDVRTAGGGRLVASLVSYAIDGAPFGTPEVRVNEASARATERRRRYELTSVEPDGTVVLEHTTTTVTRETGPDVTSVSKASAIGRTVVRLGAGVIADELRETGEVNGTIAYEGLSDETETKPFESATRGRREMTCK